MIHLPRQAEYALMILAEMHNGRPGQLFTARALSHALHIPYDVTAKAMQGMNRAAILCSVQGKKGGYRIATDLRQVSLEFLLEAVSAAPALTPCLLHKEQCTYHTHCTIRTSIARLDRRVRNLFRDVSLFDLVG